MHTGGGTIVTTATVSVLGPLALTVEGENVVVAGHRRRAVLARLAVEPGIPVTSDRLAEDLWWDEPDKRSVPTLRTYVTKLRNLLPGGGDLLASSPAGYALMVPPEALDAVRFEQLVGDALRRPDDAEAVLTEALALWRGGAFEEFADLDWARVEASRLDELRLLAQERLVQAKLDRGGHAEVVPTLAALAAAHPLRERFHVQLVTALYRSGRQVEALDAQRRARAALLHELGLEPGDELASLEHQILVHDRVLASPAVAAGDAPPLSRPSRLPPMLRPRRGEPAFVGRSAELASIASALAEAREGGARLLVVQGEPGIGKTRLAAEAAAAAWERGATVLHGRCDDGLGAPHQPYVDALKEFAARAPLDTLAADLGADAGTLALLVPEFAAHLPVGSTVWAGADPAAEQHRLFDAVAGWLGSLAAQAPVLLVVDDMQWATRSTVLLTQHVVRALHDRPLVVLATARAADLTPAHDLVPALDALRRSRAADVLPVTGLGADELAVLLAAERAGAALGRDDVEQLRAATGGSPFLATEIARHGGGLGGGVPASVRDVLLPRVARMADATQAVVHAASVVGPEFELDVVAAVVDRPEDEVLGALDDAVATGLVHELDGVTARYGFAHAILQRTVYESRTGSWRSRCHAKVASLLEGRPAADADDVAHHWQAAGAPHADRAAAAWGRAGRDALDRLAYDDAVRHLTAAVRLSGDAPPDVRGRLLLDLADAHARNGDAATARTSLVEAALLARTTGNPVALARAALGTSAGGRGVSEWIADDLRTELLEEAYGALPETERELRVDVAGALALALHLPDQRSRRQALAREAVDAAEADGSRALLAAGLPASRVRFWRPSDAEARRRYAASVLGIAEDAGDPWLAGAANQWVIGDSIELGDRAGFDAAVARGRELADRVGGVLLPWQASVVDAQVATLRGDLVEAERLAADALTVWGADPAPDAVETFGYQLGVIRILQGRGEEVLALCDQALLGRPTAVGLHAVRALALAMTGRLDEAAAVVARCAADDLDLLPQDSGWLMAAAFLAEAVVRTRQVDEAASVRRALAPHRDRFPNLSGPHVCWGTVAHQLGALDLLLGDRAAALGHLDRAEELERAFGAIPWLARTTALRSRL